MPVETASKPFKKGYQIYHTQKVQNVAIHRVIQTPTGSSYAEPRAGSGIYTKQLWLYTGAFRTAVLWKLSSEWQQPHSMETVYG